MDEKQNPAVDSPAAATDQAQNPSSNDVPTTEAEQGAGTVAAQPTTSTEDTDAAHADDSTADSDQGGMSEFEEAMMTMEDVMAASDDQLTRRPIHRGMVLTGTVIMLSQEGVVVDVGAKIEGVIPYNQLFEFEAKPEDAGKYVKSGDEIQVYVIRADIPNGTIVLSKKRADQERAWNLLHEIFEKELPVEVEIVEKVRGGLVANLGVRAFLPASQVDIRRVNDLSPYVDQRMKVKIIELNRKRNRVIISRRAIVEQEVSGLKQETLQKLEPGAKLEGEIVEITDFGAFVNLGGIDGLVHRSELTHGRFNHPREAVKVGQKVRVEVLDMDLERERINLSMKRLVANPWENVLVNYHIGQKISGKVTNLTPFGAFVEIEAGLEGLIHVSEMSWTKRVRHPKEIVNEGDEVEAMILKIDTQQERISLGLRQTQPDPWSSLPDRYPPGTEVTGPITGLTEFGVFMEIEEGIEGLIHISELAHEHIEDVSEHFAKGDEVTAVILNIDPVEQRASLSRKRLLPFTASDFDADSVGTGTPASRGGGRKGRRGGRRSQGIDYDYSYASDAAGSKTTTKLGDVYADLFAQFGLGDSKGSKADDAQSASSSDAAGDDAAQSESVGSDAASEGTVNEANAAQSTPGDASTDRAEGAAAEAAPEERTEERQDAAKPAEQPKAEAEADVDPRDAIDAAEAAALLTAAFRQGRRPAAEQKNENEEGNGNEEPEKTEA